MLQRAPGPDAARAELTAGRYAVIEVHELAIRRPGVVSTGKLLLTGRPRSGPPNVPPVGHRDHRTS